MTLTSHGHKIPGSPTYDDSEDAPKARCGGPALCPVCNHESQRYINGRAGAQMKMHAEASGSGALTAGELMHQLLGVPPEATLHIRTDGDQRDGPYWSVKAEWERTEAPYPDKQPREYHMPFNETAEINIGSTQTRDVHIPISGEGGFAPVPTTGPIQQQNKQHYGELGVPRANDWSNPYKGQWGDH